MTIKSEEETTTKWLRNIKILNVDIAAYIDKLSRHAFAFPFFAGHLLLKRECGSGSRGKKEPRVHVFSASFRSKWDAFRDKNQNRRVHFVAA